MSDYDTETGLSPPHEGGSRLTDGSNRTQPISRGGGAYAGQHRSKLLYSVPQCMPRNDRCRGHGVRTSKILPSMSTTHHLVPSGVMRMSIGCATLSLMLRSGKASTASPDHAVEDRQQFVAKHTRCERAYGRTEKYMAKKSRYQSKSQIRREGARRKGQEQHLPPGYLADVKRSA